MIDDPAAIGDVVTGAVIAAAVEPDRGAVPAPARGHCANCQTELLGTYCHGCGQRGHVHRTIGAIGYEIAHSVFHFEGKLWRTLPMLMFRPGDLTRRYVHGERARFITPLALFLFSVFLMFATFSWIGGPLAADATTTRNGKALSQAVLATEVSAARALVAKLEANRASALLNRMPAEEIADIDDALADANEELKGLSLGAGVIQGVSAAEESQAININTGWQRLDSAAKRALDNRSLLLYKIQTSAYKFSWALIPLSLPMVWLLFFWRRQFKLYDHAVFITYSLSFMTLLLVMLSLLRATGLPQRVLGAAMVFIPPLHLYSQVRHAYGTSRRAALLRMFLLLIAAGIALGVFAALLITLGLLD